MQIDVVRWWARLQFNAAARIHLYRKIDKMLSNGLPLLKILEELHDRASDQGRRPSEPMALVLDDCRRMVQNGGLLSEALGGWAPKTEQMIIMAGERAGCLPTTLSAVVEVVQSGKKIKSVIVGGVSYPIAVMTLILMYMYIFGTRVIPQFALVTDPTKWQGAAKSLYVMSQLVQNWMAIIVVALVAVLVTMVVSMPRWCGNVRVLFDNFVPYSIYRLIAGSSFLMAFSALQVAGVTVEKSLVRLSDDAQPWLRERIEGALLGVKSGLNCGEALRNAGYGFPSKEIIDDLCVYAEYRGFADALRVMADEWMEEGVETVAMQMKVLNGVSIVLLAIVIGWLVTGFFGIQHEIATMTRAAH